jgi:hypothetical protein
MIERHHSIHVVLRHAERRTAVCVAYSGGGAGTAVIDLHGQHIGEALKLLRREVARLRGTALHKGDSAGSAASTIAQREPRARAVRILVGTNAHSKARCSPRMRHASGPKGHGRSFSWCTAAPGAAAACEDTASGSMP